MLHIWEFDPNSPLLESINLILQSVKYPLKEREIMAIQSASGVEASGSFSAQNKQEFLCGSCRGVYPVSMQRIRHALRCAKQIERNDEFVPVIDAFFQHKIPTLREPLSVVFPFRYRECSVIKELKIIYNPMESIEKRMIIDFSALNNFFKYELCELILSKFHKESGERIDVGVITSNKDLLLLLEKDLRKRKSFSKSYHVTAYFTYAEEKDSAAIRKIKIHYQPKDLQILMIDASDVIGLSHELADQLIDFVSCIINSTTDCEKAIIWGVDRNEDVLPIVKTWIDQVVITTDIIVKNFFIKVRREHPSNIYRLGIRYYPENAKENISKKLLIDLPEEIRVDKTMSTQLIQLISGKFEISESSTNGFVIRQNNELFAVIEGLIKDGLSPIIKLDKTVSFIYAKELGNQNIMNRYVRIKYDPGEICEKNSKILVVDINNATGIDKSYSEMLDLFVKEKLQLYPSVNTSLFDDKRIVRCFREMPEEKETKPTLQAISDKLEEYKEIDK